MRPSRRLAALALAFSSVTVTCIYPTERDSSVHVSLTPIHILFSGHDTVATARVWQVRGPGDSVPIPNVVFAWSSSNANAATVDNTGKIVGIASGTTVIRAAASNFDKGQVAAADTLRVSAPIEVDSIRPRTVRYGEFLSVYGVGVDSIRVATLDSAALIPNPFADTTYAEGTQRRRYWVPFPARTDSLVILGIYNGNGVFGFVRGETTKVVERDIYEPDDTIPAPINLDAPPPFAALPTLVFFNPALAFERLKRGEKTGADWYHFTQAETRDLTFSITAPQIAGTFLTFLTDSLGWNGAKSTYFIGHDSWTFGPGSHSCHGARFSPSEGVGDSTIVAFKNLRAGSLDGIAIYTAAGRYGLGVIAGYQSELPADAHEDDNSCNAADLRDTLQPPFRDTLAIENPHDVDWLRVHLTGSLLGTTYQFRLHALPGVHPDSLKDLDLYVLKVPQPGDTVMQIVAADTSAGSDANLTTTVTTTGDYYVTVVDFAGTATMYEVCVGTVPLLAPAFCNSGFPAPPRASPNSMPRIRAKRMPLQRPGLSALVPFRR
ncbi:MAG TPA: hypothetical protein VFD76_06400 [Gemmatimonadales bacterium]|nr:hypothetical protein [Gemmatimonadales bacterium]